MATSMMEELRIADVPAPGGVLSLGAPFLFHPKYKTLFVRACYPRLFEVLAASEVEYRFILTGTPGIGKSLFFYYLLARLLQSEKPPPFIVWQNMQQPGKAWCYNHETGEVRFGGDISFFRAELNNSATWYITDGVPPLLGCMACTVQITSPKRETYKEMIKSGAQELYVPLWSLDELLHCHRAMYSIVDEALVRQLYEHYGGVARYVLEHPSWKPRAGLDKLLGELRHALVNCSTEQMLAAVRALDMGPEVSHRLLHIVADDDFDKQQLVFASQWAADEFTKRAFEEDLQGLVRLLNGTSGALKGMLYEPTMHAILAKGGVFTVAPIRLADLERGMEEEVQLSSSTTEFFKDGDKLMEGVYFRPISPNYALLDSFQCVGDTVNLFQITVSSFKPVNATALNKALKKLNLGDKTIRLFFVVPPDNYRAFKAKAEKAWPSSKRQQPAARIQLFVMEGLYARPRPRVQVRALLTQQGARRPVAAGFRGGLGR